MFFTVLASLCAAVAAGCLFLLVFDLFRMIEIEKQEDEMHEYARLPLFFRIRQVFSEILCEILCEKLAFIDLFCYNKQRNVHGITYFMYIFLLQQFSEPVHHGGFVFREGVGVAV